MPKKIKIKKVKYITDLGGIKTVDGRSIKHGMLFKGSHLAKLKRTNVRMIKNLNIDTIVDLRSEGEVKLKPDVKIDGINYMNMPLLSNDDNPAINRHTATKVLRKYTKQKGGSFLHMCGIYRKLVTDPMALESYREQLRKMLDGENNRILWHCTQGKDRTGIETVLILSILGVSKEEIFKDYMSYNKMGRIKNMLIFIGSSLVTLSIKMGINLQNLINARRAYLESAYDEIDKVFGNIENFIHKALLLDDNDIEKIRANYLI